MDISTSTGPSDCSIILLTKHCVLNLLHFGHNIKAIGRSSSMKYFCNYKSSQTTTKSIKTEGCRGRRERIQTGKNKNKTNIRKKKDHVWSELAQCRPGEVNSVNLHFGTDTSGTAFISTSLLYQNSSWQIHNKMSPCIYFRIHALTKTKFRNEYLYTNRHGKWKRGEEEGFISFSDLKSPASGEINTAPVCSLDWLCTLQHWCWKCPVSALRKPVLLK